jgi:hypothetical protein
MAILEKSMKTTKKTNFFIESILHKMLVKF